MLKALRYDFYKIFKSKALLGVFVASICLSFLDSFLVGFDYGETCVCRSLSVPMLVQYLPLVFTVPFACKDFSSKFIKNVFPEYSLKDKICYVLSKIVYIFAVNLIWYVVFFLSYCAFVSVRLFLCVATCKTCPLYLNIYVTTELLLFPRRKEYFSISALLLMRFPWKWFCCF